MRGIVSARAAAVAIAGVLGAGCAHYAEPTSGLCLARSIQSKPFVDSRVNAADLEDVAFENGTDLLWIGDDSANQLYIVDSETGRFRARLRERDFLAAFPEARACDNGSAEVECSYTAELESVAYDEKHLTLYVLNTVNRLELVPAVDKPALFKLSKLDPDSNLLFVDWRPLPEGYKYGPMVVIDGQLHVSVYGKIYAFDFDANHFRERGFDGAPVAAYDAQGGIVGLASFGAYLWILTTDNQLAKVDWSRKEEVERHDLTPIGFSRVKGLALGRGELFVVEGDHPNPVQVLRNAQVQGVTRAAFLGGWPRSCP